MNPETYQRGMARMGAALSVEPTPGQMAIYWEELGDLDDITFTAAVKAAIRSAPKMYALPTLGAILKEVAQVRAALGETRTALDAWGEFRRTVTLRLNLDLLARSPKAEMTRVGLTPLDAQIARRLGGFKHLIEMTPRDMDFKAKEFQAVYDELSAKRRTEEQLIALEPAQPKRIPLLAEGDGYDR